MMWELGIQWGDDGKIVSAYDDTVPSIHILLVDHDSESRGHAIRVLEICRYRVTYVEYASSAVSIIASGTPEYDLVMADAKSPNLYGNHGSKLLQCCGRTCTPILLMSADDDQNIVIKALENGAFLCVKKPITLDLAKSLWQHAIREKTRMKRQRNAAAAAAPARSLAGLTTQSLISFRNGRGSGTGTGIVQVINKETSKDRSNKKSRISDAGEAGSNNRTALLAWRNNENKKSCTEWTEALHQKFMLAVQTLGDGRCFPKDILELMNVPGLTRMQVASHLQKCRNDKWRKPEDRRVLQSVQPAGAPATAVPPLRAVAGLPRERRRFGSMPVLVRNPSRTRKEAKAANPGLAIGKNRGNLKGNNPTAVKLGSASRIRVRWYGAGPSNAAKASSNMSKNRFNGIQALSGSVMNRNPAAYPRNPGAYPGTLDLNQASYHFSQDSEGPSVGSGSTETTASSARSVTKKEA